MKNTLLLKGVIEAINGEEIVGIFYETNRVWTSKSNQDRQAKNYIMNGKATIIILTAGLIKKFVI